MNRKSFLSGLILMVVVFYKPLPGQQILDDSYILNMRSDMKVLASDSLEGREAGTLGELLAALYIAGRFEEMNLKPWFQGCYYQDFDFSDGYQFTDDANSFIITMSRSRRDKSVSIDLPADEFSPYAWGGDGNITGVVADAGFCLEGYKPTLSEQRGKHEKRQRGEIVPTDLEGRIALIRYDRPPDYQGKETNLGDLMFRKAEFAKSMGAVGVIFYDPSNELKHAPGSSLTGQQVFIPIVYMFNAGLARTLPGQNVELNIKASKKRSPGKNVVAWIDNNAEQTIVIGAHIDHLGWGIYNSRHSGPPAIHYGADDNASGVTGMLALAEWLSKSDLTNKNYLFAGFSAEEKGLIGSRTFTDDTSISSDNIFAMLNFDMIGRVKPDEPEISLLGAGSSQRWEELLSMVSEDVTGKPVKGGLNGSDHYHFYNNGIPVLFFFNGIHDDYHKPSDVPEKINYTGLRDVVEYSINLLKILDTLPSLPYQKYSEEERGARGTRRFSLGIVPGHGMDVKGVFVQDVTRQWPAETAGIVKGDIIVRIGDTDIDNIHHYMLALNKIKEGEKIEVVVIRDGKPKIFHLQF